jgi:hypothetical protein
VVDEQSPEVLDAVIGQLNGAILRLPLADVEAEIAAAEEAQRAAKKEARKALREARREERKEKIHAKVAELKSKLHIDRPVTSDRS